eukprot:14356011-Alexandrium_andersonii.AAC.1
MCIRDSPAEQRGFWGLQPLRDARACCKHCKRCKTGTSGVRPLPLALWDPPMSAERALATSGKAAA